MFISYAYKALKDQERMNEYIDYVKKNRVLIMCAPTDEKKDKTMPRRIRAMSHTAKAYLAIGTVKIDLYFTNDAGENVNYVFFMDNREVVPQISPATAMSAFSNTVREEVPKAKAPKNFSARPLIGYNKEYENQRIEAFGYDINSAYASVVLDDEWIDTSKEPVDKIIEAGEVGFDLDFEIQREGYAPFVFPIIPVPDGVKRYFLKHYKAKQEAGAMYKATKDEQWKVEKQKEKDMLNFPIGCLQNKNPWIRAWIVGKCNERIRALIDEDTLFWNTDSIVSKRKREDIEANMGDGLGQWKLEHHDEVAYIGNNYQWGHELPTYRGISKQWFPENYDILRDGTPPNRNVFSWDSENKIITIREVSICQE